MSLSVNGLRRSAWAVLALGLSTVGMAYAADGKPDLPIKRVVMFNSGLAFFEHNGDVEGNATVDLKFNVRDINDLLKSMVLQDAGGGKISTVSYGSKDPITRTLATFAIDLTKNPTLADLLIQVRGEQVEIDAPNKIVGTIVGIEKRKQPVGKDETVEVEYLTLLTDDGLRSVPLSNVGKIKLSNPKLDAELRLALTVLAQSHATDKKTVTLNFLGNGKRPVKVGYVQESPVWKTSYRLVLADGEQPLLQGWAIVENTTEADWNNVNLSLISGRPISFVMDLYEPLYVGRPEEKLELYASLRPRTYEQDLARADQEFKKMAEISGGPGRMNATAAAPAAPPRPGFGGFARGEGKGEGYVADAKADYAKSRELRESFQSVAQAGDVGEMFQYNIATPVTLQRGRSAMLPIVNESVKGEKVSIYNPAVHGKHPLNGLRFNNTTELNLMQGPITVFDDGAYAGDAKIASLPPGTERLISYAMDLDTEVAPTSTGKPEELVAVKIVDGVLHATRKFQRTQSYVVKNSGKRAKNVLIEYPIDLAWHLISPKELEKTRNEYRFAVKAEPGKPANLELQEERTAVEQVAVTNLPDHMIQIYLGSKTVSDKVKEALKEVVKRKQAINEMARAREEIQRQIQVISQEQERIRGNMAQLPKDSDLFRRYVTKFTQQEDQVEALREKVTASLAEEAKLQKSLNDFLATLTLV